MIPLQTKAQEICQRRYGNRSAKVTNTLEAIAELKDHYKLNKDQHGSLTSCKLADALQVEGSAAWLVHNALKRQKHKNSLKRGEYFFPYTMLLLTGVNKKPLSKARQHNQRSPAPAILWRLDHPPPRTATQSNKKTNKTKKCGTQFVMCRRTAEMRHQPAFTTRASPSIVLAVSEIVSMSADKLQFFFFIIELYWSTTCGAETRPAKRTSFLMPRWRSPTFPSPNYDYRQVYDHVPPLHALRLGLARFDPDHLLLAFAESLFLREDVRTEVAGCRCSLPP